MVRAFTVALAALVLGFAGLSGASAQDGASQPLNLKQFRAAKQVKKKPAPIAAPSKEAAQAMARHDESQDIASPAAAPQTAATTARGFADDPNVRITTLPVRVVSPDEVNEIDLETDPPYVVASNEYNALDRAADARPAATTDGRAVTTTAQASLAASPSHLAALSWLAPLLLSVGFAFAAAIGAGAFIRRKPKSRARA